MSALRHRSEQAVPDPSDASSPALFTRLAVGFLGLSSVLSLLAWVYELAPFRAFFALVSLPLTAALVAIGILSARRKSLRWWREAIVAGALGGFVGTLAYDLFRVPFVAVGFQVLAPVDSYGLLLLDADSSSAWTGLVGWSYHFFNGIGFGVAYAVVAKGRRWFWGVLWALVLETATIITPFADSYNLRGQWVPISIAYAAHVAYGAALGLTTQRAVQVSRDAIEVLRAPVLFTAVTVVTALTIWLQPWRTDAELTAGQRVAPGASAVIAGDDFAPLWLRVPEGECATVRNDSDRTYGFAKGSTRVLAPGERTELCFADGTVHRVRLTVEGRERGHTGGFMITDPNP